MCNCFQFFSVFNLINMDSGCPVIENVDDNSNKGEVNDTTLSSQEQENNSNELSSVNDNESATQNQNSDEQELTRNLVNKSLQGDSVESSESTASGSMMEETNNSNNKTEQSESESVNNQQHQVKWNVTSSRSASTKLYLLARTVTLLTRLQRREIFTK